MPMSGRYGFVCLCTGLDITYGRGERQVILVAGLASSQIADLARSASPDVTLVGSRAECSFRRPVPGGLVSWPGRNGAVCGTASFYAGEVRVKRAGCRMQPYITPLPGVGVGRVVLTVD
jgi:alpha-D-ribose 1-methylphosphonate 5-triphosphate synthase subunit PhnG